MFCYTSGTTGDPKAAMLSHRNLLAAATSCKYGGIDVTPEDCYISYLPLAHSFEKCLFVMALIRGIRIGYYSGDVLKLTEDCEALRPTLFPSVPRLFCRIYDKITSRLKELTGVKSYLANRAIQSKLYYLEHQAAYSYGFYDMAVCNKFRAILGGRVRLMVTGSAPISVDVLNYLKVCFCCPILEGYGQTESSAASCITLPQDPKAGHVGGPLPCLKIRLRDLPDMEYTSHDTPYPRGEICFKGPSVFQGYYKNDEKTAEALHNGWLWSGDVGVVLPNGSIKIIDRAKNIFKLAQGEYIAPEKLENVYIQSPFIQQIFVHGDSLESFLVAIVVPDFHEVTKWNKQQPQSECGDTSTPEEICKSAAVNNLIVTSMEQLATANKFNGLEKIKKIYLSPEPFSIENDLLTPSMKLKRGVAAKVFKD
jgi:long-chain acyl-CoA synthetase